MLAACLAFLGTACTQDKGRADDDTDRAAAPLAVEADSAWVALAAKAEAEGYELIEAADDGRVLVGRRRPVPPDSSARLVFDALLIDALGRRQPLPGQARLQDARFAPAPSHLVALLDDRDNLVVWNTDSGDSRVVDQEVFPGFGFSHSAARLVYSKGPAPELDAWRHDLDSRQSVRLTTGGLPVWGFAFSPDDSKLVFVDSPDGFPCLATMAPDGSGRTRLTNKTLTRADVRAGRPLAPFPDGRRPPIWTGAGIYVEGSTGVHALGVDGHVLWSVPGARELHQGRVRGSVVFREADRFRRVP